MAPTELNALIDSDVLLDFLGWLRPGGGGTTPVSPAFYQHHLLDGGDGRCANAGDEATRRGFLSHFEILPLTELVAEQAVALRRAHRLKLPDAVILATANAANCLLVSRNAKDFPSGQPGIRFPYRR